MERGRPHLLRRGEQRPPLQGPSCAFYRILERMKEVGPPLVCKQQPAEQRHRSIYNRLPSHRSPPASPAAVVASEGEQVAVIGELAADKVQKELDESAAGGVGKGVQSYGRSDVI